MSDFAIWYQKPRKKDFWCEQDGKWHPECQCKTQCFDCGLVQGEMKTQMKKTIEELALEYIASIAGTDPNLDISQYEADYNAFIAGANAVKSSIDLNDVVTVAEQLYYEVNPNTKMDVPSFAYEQVESANKRQCRKQQN